MWALCPPAYHDNDMPIDLRKKVVLEREQQTTLCRYDDSRRPEDVVYAPRDYSIKECRDRWQPAYGAAVPAADDKPQDLRPANRGTLETAIKKLHINSKLRQAQGSERCRSTDALLEKGSPSSPQRPPRSSSCPDLNVIEQKPTSSSPHSHPLRASNGAVTTPLEVKNYPEYNGYSPEREDVHSPVVGGARKRKSFVPLYGDRAPVYERPFRSPSPQHVVYSERGYRSPSPKRPVYVRNGYHSPSPETYIYRERIYRSPSPKRALYSDRHCYSPSPPTRPAYEERRLRSPSPKRLVYGDRIYHSPSPKRPLHSDRGFRSPSPKRPLLYRGFRSPSPKRRPPKSPPSSENHQPYDEYFAHPEVLLRRQLSQHGGTSPYFLHVYDYYQHLVQRLREHHSPSPSVRIGSPVSPTPVEEEVCGGAVSPDAQRKRPCRALTGKHVRQGTGASLSTLLTLRQKIQERQKAKEHHHPPRTAANGINGKNSPSVRKVHPKKMKLNMKGALGKIQNC